jgi:uncharacterized protein Yka (UPF0111/DUF47 family)
MFARVSQVLAGLREEGNKAETVDTLVEELKDSEEYADEMREELTRFFIECTRQRLSSQSEARVYRLLRIISDLEDMTDDCYSVSLLLNRSVRKDHIFKNKEMEALVPYVGKVEDFLRFVKEHLSSSISGEQALFAEKLENEIDKSRDRLRKLGRKRIEAGVDVRTELLFIDVVRRIEKVGDYCYNIAETLIEKGSGRPLPRSALFGGDGGAWAVAGVYTDASVQGGEPAEALLDLGPAAAGEIRAAPAVLEQGVPAEEDICLFVQEAHGARGVAGNVQGFEGAYFGAFSEQDICGGHILPKGVYVIRVACGCGEAFHVGLVGLGAQVFGVILVDGNGRLFGKGPGQIRQGGDMVKVAVGK